MHVNKVRAIRPNVIWIFGDQMCAQAMRHMGDPNVSTPNIDRSAAEEARWIADTEVSFVLPSVD